MQARRAARELALILLSQLDKNPKQYTDPDFKEIVLTSVRTLTNNAQEELKSACATLVDLKNRIDDIEGNAEINLERPLNASNLPVPLPLTSDMTGKLEELLNICENTMLALEIAELTTLEENDDVKSYIMKIVDSYKDNKDFIDSQIKKFAFGWDLNRLVKIDKDILRIAICELVFVKDAPLKVIIDEALELAKKYSTEDSASFINGVLGKVVIENALV
ncbi:transcription antitermination factor NusB [bacterium]|nr:transcription antitermination factor NusB [bacterium]